MYIYYRSLTLIRGGLLLHLLGTFETILSGLRHRKDLRIRRSNGSASSTIMVMHLIEFLCETHFGGEVIAYSAIHPIIRKVLKMRICGVPLAGGLLLQLPTAQAGPRIISEQPYQNIPNEWMNSSVVTG